MKLVFEVVSHVLLHSVLVSEPANHDQTAPPPTVEGLNQKA
jgi:hypothetical protein